MRIGLLLLALAAATAAFPQPSEYVAALADVAPLIDGEPSDACWQAASAPLRLFTIGGSNEPAKNDTRVRLVMDAKALYVAVEAATAPGKPPTAQVRERDGKTWNDDSIELFVGTAFTDDSYYHLAFNALGNQMDARHAPGIAPDETMAWDGDWTVATRLAEGGWTAEARIPWSTLGSQTAPARGWVWKIKIGCAAAGYRHSMWPINQTSGFHDQACWGNLILVDPNLAPNAGLEDGIPEGTRPPNGWLFAYHATEGQGVCTVTDADAASGSFAARLEKTDDNQWFPVLYVNQLPVQPGSTYELSAMIRCEREYSMRYTLIGEHGEKRSQSMPATDGWQRVRIEAAIPDEGVDGIMLGWQLIKQRGVILVDDVVVRRLNDVTGRLAALPTPHPYHNLEALAERTAFKPYALLRNADGAYQTDRVIFRDSGTGAQIWCVSRSARASTRHFYMEMTPWNADGSLLSFHAGQLGKGSVLMPADASEWSRLPFYASSAIWDRQDPTRLWHRQYRGHQKTDLWDLATGNVLTGEVELKRRFEGDIGLWPMSQDGQKLLVQELLIDDEGKHISRLWVMNRDGLDGVMLTPGGWTHQTWFTKALDYSIEFEWEGQKPAGQYIITTDNVVHKICDTTYGHRAHSPDGVWLAGMGACHIRNKQTNEVRVLSPESSNHQTWEASEQWYCTSSGRYLVRVVAFGSPTVQRLGAHNSQLKHSTYWSEAHPEMSHDGTKLGYASSMLGDIEFYFLVMRQPDAPQAVTAEVTEAGVRLSWQPGQFHRETRGYIVYTSTASGEPGRLLTPEPVSATEYTIPPQTLTGARGEPLYARVSAIEHSGLESLPSAEVILTATEGVHQNQYVEAESGDYTATAEEVFDPTAAGLYGIALGKLRASGPLSLSVERPRGRPAARLWVRARAQSPADVQVSIDGARARPVRVENTGWAWLSADVQAAAGEGGTAVELAPSGPGITVDRICLATDPGYTPTGLGGLDETPPDAVTGLEAAPEGSYAVRLRWDATPDERISHYNVYACTQAEFDAAQECLIASPARPEYIDWGLKAGTVYYYRVTAVDRSGNESAPSQEAQATTSALNSRLFAEVSQTWNTTDKRSAELAFTMPADGQFVLWGNVQSLDGVRSAPIELLLDGESLGSQGIHFDYICVGHGGPVLNTWLWNCFRPSIATPDASLAFGAPAGEHVLTLKAPESVKVLFDGFVVTNDLGFEPKGTVDFVVRPERD